MDRITIKTSSLTSDFQFDGISLEPQFGNISKYYGIPQTLHNVDKKFHTHTFRDVLEAAAPTLDVLVDGTDVQVLDPKSVYLADEQFDELISIAEQVAGKTAKTSKNKFQRQATLSLGASDSDTFLSDIFSRTWTVTRRAEGGLSFSTDIIRLACTNGMVVPDKQFSGFVRAAKVDKVYITGFHDAAEGFKVEEYLKALFIHNGTPVPCSLADLIEMKECLASLTDDDLPDMLFPVQQVEDFYSAQGIDTTKLARKYLDKLPTGLSYYQALQILTNGAKSMLEKTVDNQVKVARFCRPSRMKNMKDVDLHWQGIPEFSSAQVHSWMGDGVVK